MIARRHGDVLKIEMSLHTAKQLLDSLDSALWSAAQAELTEHIREFILEIEGPPDRGDRVFPTAENE